MMIENRENVIICCPTKQLVTNKEAQYPNERCRYNVLGVLKGVTRRDVHDYIEQFKNEQPIKILVTYNSFEKVLDVLGDAIHGYRIVVDEFQEILDGAIYRDKTMIDLLQKLEGIEQVTYLSATPIPTEFLPEQLVNQNRYEINWGKNQEVIVPHRIEVDSPFSYIARMIIEHKAGNPFKIKGQAVENYFFYINSVSAIAAIIKKTGLTNEEVNVICADNAANRLKLEDKKNGTVPLEGEANKTFTFCTKSVFFGIDFFSKAGLTIIVSDGRHKSTMLDVSTDIRQIAGRIRNEDNLFRFAMLHVYNTGYIIDKEDFECELANDIVKANRDIEAFERLKDSKGEGQRLEYSIIEKVENNGTESLLIYNKQNQNMYLNELKIKYSRWKFNTIHEVYADGLTMSEAYSNAGYDMEEAIQWEQQMKDYVQAVNKIPMFKVLYEEYLVVMGNKPKNFAVIPDRAKEIEELNSLVAKAYIYLTPEKVKALRYNVTDIKKEIRLNMPETKKAVKQLLKKDIKSGDVFTNVILKEKLQGIYDELLIEAKAKASDILQYGDAHKVKVRVGEERKDGFRIDVINRLCSWFR